MNKAWETRYKRYGQGGYKDDANVPFKKGDSNIACRPKERLRRSIAIKGDKNPSKRLEVREKIRNTVKEYYKTHDGVRKGCVLSIETRSKIGETRTQLFNQGLLKTTRGAKHTIGDIEKMRQQWDIRKNGENQQWRERFKVAAINRKGHYPKTNTIIEITLQNALKNLNIPFKTDEPIENITKADIFIIPNICIFADGNYWHNYPNGRESDRDVTRRLKEKGFEVLRFWESEIRKDLNGCIHKIIQSCIVQNFCW